MDFVNSECKVIIVSINIIIYGGYVLCNPSTRPRISEEAIQEQLEWVLSNVGAYSFSFLFTREKIELMRLNTPGYPEYIEKDERYAQFAQYITNFTEVPQSSGSHCYVTVRMSPGQAVDLIKRDFGNLSWSVSRKFGKVADEDMEENTADNPPLGINMMIRFNIPRIGDQGDTLEIFHIDKRHEIRDILMKRHLIGGDVQVSWEYNIKTRDQYRDGESANPTDFYRVRVGIWHEIMEISLIHLGTEAFCYPYALYKDLLPTEDRGEGPKNFAHQAIVQGSQPNILEPTTDELRQWIHQIGDPPFDAFESAAYSLTNSARASEIAVEQFSPNDCRKWHEVKKAWEKALQAWQAVPYHESKQSMIDECSKKIEDTSQMISRLSPGYSFELLPLNKGFKIEYWNWPSSFTVTIYSYAGMTIQTISQTSSSGTIRWGDQIPRPNPGIYYIKINDESERRRVGIL